VGATQPKGLNRIAKFSWGYLWNMHAIMPAVNLCVL
jgi:hypothetical protein